MQRTRFWNSLPLLTTLLVFFPWLGIGTLCAEDPGSFTSTPSPTATTVEAIQPQPAASMRSFEKAGTTLIKDRPWLEDLYSWKQAFDLDRQEVEANKVGAYCIGNGRAFALIGLSSPLWSWSNIYGAYYQAPELGGLRMSVTRAGVEAACPQQQIGWVKRSGVVRVRARGKGLTVETYDFAPVTPSEDNAWDNPAVLVRLVHIVNTSDHTESDLDIEMKVQPDWKVHLREKVEGKDLLIDHRDAKAKKRTVWRLGAFNSKRVRIWDDNLHYGVPTLKAGGETWAAFYLLAANSFEENRSAVAEIRKKGPLPLMDETRGYYVDWFEKGTTFTGDPKMADLFEIESLIFKSQQAQTGGYSPLIGYSYTWIRDNNGPIRWFLKTGHTQEARRAMDFFYGVASTMGSLPNSVRVNYPLTYRRKDLSDMKVEHAETPNWIVLQHWWYYETTGDLELIRARWSYLKRCIFGQLNVDDKYFFQRDETYLWCLEGRIFDHVPFPNYYLSTFAFTPDSAFELVSAADRLAYLGKYLEMDKDVSALKKLSTRVRAKTEETYWNAKAGYWAPAQSLLGPLYNAPFANILLNPFWCGYARNDLDPLGVTPEASQKAETALRSGYLGLGRPDGFWKTTPTVDFFVGMNPGQLLYDLCVDRSPWADKAYSNVLKAATPSGDFVEMYDGEYRPWNPPALGVGTSGRVRPWEGGLNTEALFEYLTGFSPDAGNGRVVFAPHLPENMDGFGAQRLDVGPAKVSLTLKRSGRKQWTATLHLDRGEQLEVTMDFWASRLVLEAIETDAKGTWDKAVADTSGREGRFTFTLDSAKDYSFTVSEGSPLPQDELEPPKSVVFQPDPYDVPEGDLLLLTSPTSLLNKHSYKYVDPDNFIGTGKKELKLMEKVTHSTSFLDLDLPVSAEDIVRGMLDDKGRPRFQVVVFGKGAFSSGKHHFKPESYWADPQLARGVKKFLEQGGRIFFGPSYTNREVLPDWLISLTGGGWDEGTVADHAVPTDMTKTVSDQKLLDEVKIGDEASEAAHGVTFTGETYTDTQNLPDGLNEKRMIRDQGRGFTGYGEFTVKTEPGSRHRFWVRVDTGRNIKGLALQVRDGDHWVQLGVRTQDGGTTRRFLALYFDVPEKYIVDTKTLFRLISKSGEEVNLYHLWVYKVGAGKNQPLSQLLGFGSGQENIKVGHGLLPLGKQWKVPLVLSQHPEQGALIIQRVGKGYLLRSELTLEDSTGILKALLSDQTVEQLSNAW